MIRLVTLFVTGMLTLPLLAADMTKIQVKVMNLDGKPVDRASVIVKFVSGHSVAKLGKGAVTHWEMRTNQEGIARIPSLPQGKLLVQVIAKGYQTFGGTFEVTEPEKTLELKLNPPQSQYSAHQ
jgi:Carboxypeptidase regulatory-like domain